MNEEEKKKQHVVLLHSLYFAPQIGESGDNRHVRRKKKFKRLRFIKEKKYYMVHKSKTYHHIGPKVITAREASKYKAGGGNVKIINEIMKYEQAIPKVPTREEARKYKASGGDIDVRDYSVFGASPPSSLKTLEPQAPQRSRLRRGRRRARPVRIKKNPLAQLPKPDWRSPLARPTEDDAKRAEQILIDKSRRLSRQPSYRSKRMRRYRPSSGYAWRRPNAEASDSSPKTSAPFQSKYQQYLNQSMRQEDSYLDPSVSDPENKEKKLNDDNNTSLRAQGHAINMPDPTPANTSTLSFLFSKDLSNISKSSKFDRTNSIYLDLSNQGHVKLNNSPDEKGNYQGHSAMFRDTKERNAPCHNSENDEESEPTDKSLGITSLLARTYNSNQFPYPDTARSIVYSLLEDKISLYNASSRVLDQAAFTNKIRRRHKKAGSRLLVACCTESQRNQVFHLFEGLPVELDHKIERFKSDSISSFGPTSGVELHSIPSSAIARNELTLRLSQLTKQHPQQIHSMITAPFSIPHVIMSELYPVEADELVERMVDMLGVNACVRATELGSSPKPVSSFEPAMTQYVGSFQEGGVPQFCDPRRQTYTLHSPSLSRRSFVRDRTTSTTSIGDSLQEPLYSVHLVGFNWEGSENTNTDSIVEEIIKKVRMVLMMSSQMKTSASRARLEESSQISKAPVAIEPAKPSRFVCASSTTFEQYLHVPGLSQNAIHSPLAVDISESIAQKVNMGRLLREKRQLESIQASSTPSPRNKHAQHSQSKRDEGRQDALERLSSQMLQFLRKKYGRQSSNSRSLRTYHWNSPNSSSTFALSTRQGQTSPDTQDADLKLKERETQINLQIAMEQRRQAEAQLRELHKKMEQVQKDKEEVDKQRLILDAKASLIDSEVDRKGRLLDTALAGFIGTRSP